jgi:PAS domain S-box-containing protein
LIDSSVTICRNLYTTTPGYFQFELVMKKTIADFADLLTDASIDVIMALDLDESIVAWNLAAETMYGKKKVDVLGVTVCEVLPSVKKDVELNNALEKAKQGFKSFLPVDKSFFHRSHAEIHIIPLFSDEEVYGIMIVAHDVSHRIVTEQRLITLNEELSDRIRQLQLTTNELANLTHITTHNIKQPIRLIYTAIEGIIKSDGNNLSNGGRASFRRIQSSLSRISLLIDDLVSLSQISITEKAITNVNIAEIIADIKSKLAAKIAEKRVIINVGELCEVRAHKDHIYQMIYLLLSNFIKYNQADVPTISFSCRKVILTEKDVCAPPGTYHRLLIEHNGMGLEDIDPERMDEMFSKLSEKNYQGSLIALATAYKVMQANGGWLVLENKGKESVVKGYFVF